MACEKNRMTLRVCCGNRMSAAASLSVSIQQSCGESGTMPAVKLKVRVSPTAFPGRGQQVNGFYVHSSPPKGKHKLPTPNLYPGPSG